MIHELKIESPYFEAVANGYKTFEIRFNDRGYQKGDQVVLKELANLEHTQSFTGRQIKADISYVTNYGQKEGWVVFSLDNLMFSGFKGDK